MLLAPEVRDKYRIEFFSGTSRAVEVAIARAGRPERVILSPFEHPSCLSVARWYGFIAGSEVCQIVFGPEDMFSSWRNQEDKLVKQILKHVSADEKTAVLILSQVCYSTGMVIPVENIIRRMRWSLGGSKLRIIIDGAHSAGNGQRLTISGECDSFVISAHKWLLAPEPCGIILSLDNVHKEELVPYDAWNTNLPSTTANAHMVAGLLSSLRLLNELGFECLWTYSLELRKLFTERMASKFTFIGENTGLRTSLMLALCPRPGKQWKYDFRELREYFKSRDVHVLVLSIDPSTPWVRITLRSFVEFQNLDVLCRALEEAIVE
jgi:selenocysteine lyase/cysteine desulfurase